DMNSFSYIRVSHNIMTAQKQPSKPSKNKQNQQTISQRSTNQSEQHTTTTRTQQTARTAPSTQQHGGNTHNETGNQHPGASRFKACG
ncbi:hypothetical protein, partial [Glutamicibacter arilaitensis]|uniref:hypothetical protein n=1 Tax=Glutamicibacter arilaitensis TaxID=256701 RepID=UPI003F8E0C3C